jgi:dipeptidyl aminopeptidase/acylaminoacyl peptidase
MTDKKKKNSNTKELICLEDLFQMKQISEPTFRPSTNEVYYVINQANKQDNNYRAAIWRVQDNKSSQFSQGLPRDTNIKWSPDGKQLAFISVRGVVGQSNKQDDSTPPKPQIFLIPFDGGEARQLTNAKNGVHDFKWSQDGSKIAFTSAMNKEEMQEPTKEELKDFDSDIIMLNELKKKKAEKEKTDPKVIRRNVYRAGTSFKDDAAEHDWTVRNRARRTRHQVR